MPNTIGAGSFTGTFDGGYHQISGFSYSNPAGTNNVGLFGYVSQATIRNVIIVSPIIQNTGVSYDTGALAGYLDWSNVADCSVEGGSVAGYEDVGGLVGSSNISCLAGCSSSASISGINSVGGSRRRRIFLHCELKCHGFCNRYGQDRWFDR